MTIQRKATSIKKIQRFPRNKDMLQGIHQNKPRATFLWCTKTITKHTDTFQEQG